MDERATRHLRGIELTLRASAVGIMLTVALWAVCDILLLAFAAVLLACALRGAADALHRSTGMKERWALACVVFAISMVLGALLWWRGAAIAEQTVRMMEQLTVQLGQLWQNMSTSAWGSLVAQQLRGAVKSVGVVSSYVPGFAGSVLGIGGSLVVVVASGLFLAAAPQLYLSGGLRLLPIAWRSRGRELAMEIGTTLRLWFLGQLADMLIVASLVGIGLFLLDVPLAPTLALFAGLLNFVPYVGALVGAAPALLVALSQSPSQALWVALLFTAVQMAEGNIIAPLIQKRTISLPPALTILSQTILGTLLGAFGLVLATPLTAALLTAVRMIYVEDVLERDRDGEPGHGG